MSNIFTSNRALELATKEELQYKTRLARSDMVVELIRAGTSIKDARKIAREKFLTPRKLPTTVPLHPCNIQRWDV